MATIQAGDATPSVDDSRSLSPLARLVAIYARPVQAWEGLKERVQWWIPLLLMLVLSMASAALLHNRAIVPMLSEAWDRQVANGQMQPEQLDKMMAFMQSPTGLIVSVAQQAVALPLMTFVVALVVWFGVGFVLGSGMRYRLALEVACWSLLITLPAYLLTTALAWSRETMKGVHVGFGILLPDMDPPSKLHVALGVLLDWVGPLSIWYLAVGIIGASVLSGAPRKSVAWTLGILYLVLGVFMAGLAALFTPAS